MIHRTKRTGPNMQAFCSFSRFEKSKEKEEFCVVENQISGKKEI